MSEQPRLTIGYIQQRVAEAYGLDVRLLVSPRRSREIARPRQVAMWLAARLMPGYSLPQIGRAFGNRDHTTILHGIRRIEDLSDHDPAFFETLVILRDGIEEATTPPTVTMVPVIQQAQDLSRAFTRLAHSLALSDPERAIRAFRSLRAVLEPYEGKL